MLCEATHYHVVTNTRTEQTMMFWYDYRFQVVLKHITICYVVDSGSSVHAMFQEWVCTVPKDHQFSGWQSSFGEKNVTTPSWLTLYLAGSHVPCIHLQWLNIMESHLFQLQKVIKVTNILTNFLSNRIWVVLASIWWQFFKTAALHEWCGPPSHD